jgi:teichuronic acid biosynthesis protein TuaE
MRIIRGLKQKPLEKQAEIIKNLILINLFLLFGASFLDSDLLFIGIGSIRLTLFRFSFLVLLVLVVGAVLSKDLQHPVISQKENRYSIYFFIFWLFYSLVTFFWSQDLQRWIKITSYLGIGVVFLVVGNIYIIRKKHIHTFLYIMVSMVIVHNIIGWYEVAAKRHLFIDPSRFSGRVFPVSFLNHPNDFALLAAFGSVISLVCYKISHRRTAKVVYLITAVSSGLIVFTTGSRAVILGLLLGLLFFAWIQFRKLTPFFKLVFVSLAISLGLYILFFSPFAQNFYQRYFAFSLQRNSESNRISLIFNGFHFLADTFGFGIGSGNVELWMEEYPVYSTRGIVNMHNWWMEILTAYGVIVFVFYLLVYSTVFISFWKKYYHAEDEDERVLSLGFMTCMVIFIIGSISSSSNFVREWVWIFWDIAIIYQGISYNRITGSS